MEKSNISHRCSLANATWKHKEQTGLKEPDWGENKDYNSKSKTLAGGWIFCARFGRLNSLIPNRNHKYGDRKWLKNVHYN